MPEHDFGRSFEGAVYRLARTRLIAARLEEKFGIKVADKLLLETTPDELVKLVTDAEM